MTEGGLTGARGDSGASAGPLQFFGAEGGRAGQLNAFAQALGVTLEQARQYVTEHPLEAIQWAIGVPGNPGYLGRAIADGISQNLTGADLATHVQRTAQVSVSPERAGAVWNSLFARLPAAAASNVQQAASQGMTSAVDQSAAARRQAEDVLASTRQTATDIQSQANQGVTAFDRWRDEQANRAAQFSQTTQDMLSRAREDAMRPLGKGAQDVAQGVADRFGQTGPGQYARSTRTRCPTRTWRLALDGDRHGRRAWERRSQFGTAVHVGPGGLSYHAFRHGRPRGAGGASSRNATRDWAAMRSRPR